MCNGRARTNSVSPSARVLAARERFDQAVEAPPTVFERDRQPVR
jgi:hypothetical protein